MLRIAFCRIGVLVWSVWVAACSPTLDWRAIRLGADTRLQFPCKPDRLERQATVIGRALPARMLVCDAGGLTWSAAEFDLGNPADAERAMAELHHMLLLNMKGSEEASETVALPGATVNTLARRIRIHGVRPDGSAAVARALFAARGPRIYQLVVMSRQDAPARWSAPASEFLDALRWQN